MVRVISVASLGAKVSFSGWDLADGVDYSGDDSQDMLDFQQHLKLKKLQPKKTKAETVQGGRPLLQRKK